MKNIYLDLDGVVANFDEFVENIIGHAPPLDKKLTEQDWLEILKHPRLFRDLNVYEGAGNFVRAISQLANEYHYDLKFLTAVSRKNDMPWSFIDKIHWVEKHFPGIPVWFGPYSADKHLHATVGDILIDDRITNIIRWNQAGGIGILHLSSFSQTLCCVDHLLTNR